MDQELFDRFMAGYERDMRRHWDAISRGEPPPILRRVRDEQEPPEPERPALKIVWSRD